MKCVIKFTHAQLTLELVWLCFLKENAMTKYTQSGMKNYVNGIQNQNECCSLVNKCKE